MGSDVAFCSYSQGHVRTYLYQCSATFSQPLVSINVGGRSLRTLEKTDVPTACKERSDSDGWAQAWELPVLKPARRGGGPEA
jgi:hypothetical protein